MMHPEENEIEVTVFGPGYGESIAIHLGDRLWVIVDSCLNDARQPAALSYLKEIGVDVTSEVAYIIATHWHDDHIKGLHKTLEECTAARFAMSSALSQKEFVAYLIAYDRQPEMKIGRGGSEIIKCLKIIKQRGVKPIPITQDRVICSWESGKFSHGMRMELLSLSPSDAQFHDALLAATDFLRDAAERAKTAPIPKNRISSQNKNDLSVATLLTVGELSIILGADVEEKGHPDYGWSNIVGNRREREPRPTYYKAAHHGSEGAYYEELWSDVLAVKPVSVVTPWSMGGRHLPTEEGKRCLKEKSHKAYVTSTEILSLRQRYERHDLKHIQRSGIEFRSSLFKCGSVSIRFDAATGDLIETILSNSAEQL